MIRYASIIALLLCFAASYLYAYKSGFSAGKNQIVADVSRATIEAIRLSGIESETITKELANETDEIIKDKMDDGDIAPVLRRQLDRMRNNNR